MRNRPHAAACALLASLTLTLSACSVDDTPGDGKAKKSGAAATLAPEPKDSALAAQVPAAYTKKTLVMGVSEYAPYVTFGSDGKITGLIPDLSAQLSSLLDVKIKVERTTFDAVIPGLKSGRIDLSAPSGDFTERQREVDFADFAQSSVTLMVTKDGSFHPGNGLEVCGHKVGVEKGAGTQNVLAAQNKRCAAKGKPSVDAKLYTDLPAATLALQSKRIDAVAAPSASNTSVSQNSDDRFETIELKDMLDLPAATAIYGIQAKKDSGLAPVIVKALRKMYESGTYAKLFGQWGLPLSTVTKDQIALNGSTQSQTQ
ncbi:transporter substrate-binding domain-containing protein [Streptomyces luomodiensis]|uniref:Transporter substrate-binding domain-containing protein n=1 Tax=Streptomyces luomodiensis TaxID=3026192 RepID=A0ABY9UQB4_9ACTN|nr:MULTISPECIES: transporter substrate-binding domain-containing protein [unclassified Streptomyces]WAP54285.1 transporter substrate-binding domain-containing protein [Streptomyces sp. S465]WNE94742.1 transporter substrate-binding domain-containing protein [Streptomyces sp. SCA4-21]